MRAHTPPPAGRDHEMSALRSAVTACAAGASIVVDISGDPGLGKSRLLAELAKLAQAKGLAVVTDPSSAFENRLGSVAELVAEANRGAGVLLCLDDLHSAGDATLTLLHELLRRPPGTPLILACGHRPRQSPARLLASLLHPAPHYRVVRLPLEDEEGNPFHLRLLGELATSAGLSEFARAALIRETAMLSGDELTVLRAASMLGDPFDPLLLAAVADLPDQRALDALDGLAAADLVRAADSRLLRSRHPGLREAVVRDTPPGWALAAHRRADLALRDSGADAVARAPHVARSARVGDAEAVAVLVAAARRSRHLSPGDAATWLRAALRLSAAPSFDMLLGLAEAVAMTGDLAACLDSLRQALDLVPPDRPELRVPAVALGAAARRVLAAESCSLDLERELAGWSRSDSRADPLRAQLAIMLTAQGKYDDSLLCDEVPTACRALAAAYRGRPESFPAHFDSVTDDELAGGLDEVAQFSWAEALSERHHDALRHAGRGVAVARRTGQAHLLPYLLLCQSYSQQATGDLAGGAASAAAAQQAAQRLALPKLAAFASTLQAAAAALRGGPTAAVGAVEQALRAFDRRGRLWEASAGTLAVLRLEQGRPDDCLELIRLITDSGRPVAVFPLQATWCCTAAQAEAALGNLAAARDWAARAVESADAVALPGQRAYAELALAAVHTDEPDASAEHHLRAADLFAAARLVPAEARARLSLGHRLADTHRLSDAALAIGQAKRLADASGAAHLAHLAVNAQRRIGGNRPRPGPSTLSDQEHRIAHLVARGRTNRAVAAELFISVKTVEGHLTRIFRKFRVTSRSALTAALRIPEAP